MEILIPLPESSEGSTYKELKSHLKQMELAVHHAQKSVEQAEKDGIEISDSSFITFQHPRIDYATRTYAESEESDQQKIKALKNFEEYFSDPLLSVSIRIVIE